MDIFSVNKTIISPPWVFLREFYSLIGTYHFPINSEAEIVPKIYLTMCFSKFFNLSSSIRVRKKIMQNNKLIQVSKIALLCYKLTVLGTRLLLSDSVRETFIWKKFLQNSTGWKSPWYHSVKETVQWRVLRGLASQYTVFVLAPSCVTTVSFYMIPVHCVLVTSPVRWNYVPKEKLSQTRPLHMIGKTEKAKKKRKDIPIWLQSCKE